jgi:alanyl-tRNA synthetase
MESREVRRRFVEFYTQRGFYPLPRAPLLHPSVPMSFVMSAGLVQIETSLAQLHNRPTNRFVLVQECFRHFDLDKVGTDDFHLSLFEMPGAFRFGPIATADTLQHMWQLVTQVLLIPSDRIWISYFDGGDFLDRRLPPDLPTYYAWREVGVRNERLIGLGLTGNFWRQSSAVQGDAQPRKCGPHTEMFYDRGAYLSCGVTCQPGCACGRFMEFANTLFITHQFDPYRNELLPLADPFTETVIGTERVAMIRQQAASVFDIDSMRPIIELIRSYELSPIASLSPREASERVLVDHLKALYILVADGAPPPGKDGRERIVKRLIRSVIARQLLLRIEAESFLPTIIHHIAQSMLEVGDSAIVPEQKIITYIASEAQRFRQTIERGRRQLQQILRRDAQHNLAGHEVVYLEKQCGLPRPLLDTLFQQAGAQFDEAEYQAALQTWTHTRHH